MLLAPSTDLYSTFAQPSRPRRSGPIWLALLVLLFSLSFFSFFYDESESHGAFSKLALISLPFSLFTLRIILTMNAPLWHSFYNIIKQNMIIFLLPIYGIVTSLWSSDPVDSYTRAAAFLMAAFSLSVLCVYADRIDHGRARTAISLGFICAIAIAILYPIVNPGAFPVPDPAWRDDRLGGWVIPSNTLGGFCAGMIGLCFLRLLVERISVINCLLLAAFSYVWYLTYSRGAIISTIVAIAVCATYILAIPALRMKTFIILWLTAIAAIAYIGVNADNIDIIGLLIRGDDVRDSIYTASSRSDIWGEILSRITINSLTFGSGYAQASPDGAVTFGTLTTNHAHNGYLQILTGMGIFALFAFMFYMISVLFYNLRYAGRSINGVFALYVTLFLMMNLLVEASVGFQVYPQFAMFMLFAVREWRKPAHARGTTSLWG